MRVWRDSLKCVRSSTPVICWVTGSCRQWTLSPLSWFWARLYVIIPAAGSTVRVGMSKTHLNISTQNTIVSWAAWWDFSNFADGHDQWHVELVIGSDSRSCALVWYRLWTTKYLFELCPGNNPADRTSDPRGLQGRVGRPYTLSAEYFSAFNADRNCWPNWCDRTECRFSFGCRDSMSAWQDGCLKHRFNRV